MRIINTFLLSISALFAISGCSSSDRSVSERSIHAHIITPKQVKVNSFEGKKLSLEVFSKSTGDIYLSIDNPHSSTYKLTDFTFKTDEQLCDFDLSKEPDVKGNSTTILLIASRNDVAQCYEEYSKYNFVSTDLNLRYKNASTTSKGIGSLARLNNGDHYYERAFNTSFYFKNASF